MAITVRTMTEKDLPMVIAVVTSCYRFLAEHEGFTRNQLDRLVAERCSEECIRATYTSCRCFVATDDDVVLGTVAVKGNRIEEFFVQPEYHRRGIGTALFRKAEQVIANAGHKELMVSTTGFGTPFYEAMGMQVVGQKAVSSGPLVGWELTLLRETLGDRKEA